MAVLVFEVAALSTKGCVESSLAHHPVCIVTRKSVHTNHLPEPALPDRQFAACLYVWDFAQIHNYQVFSHVGHVSSQCMLSPPGGRAILDDSGEIFPLDPTSAHSVHT